MPGRFNGQSTAAVKHGTRWPLLISPIAETLRRLITTAAGQLHTIPTVRRTRKRGPRVRHDSVLYIVGLICKGRTFKTINISVEEKEKTLDKCTGKKLDNSFLYNLNRTVALMFERFEHYSAN